MVFFAPPIPTMLDNGAAPAHVQRGRGLKIVGELIKALDGRFEQKFGTAGSMSILVFPYNEGSASPQEHLPAKPGSLLKTSRRSG